MNKLLCCNQQIEQQNLDNGNIGVRCNICGRNWQAPTIEEAYQSMLKSNPVNPVITIPQNAGQLQAYVDSHKKEIMSQAAPFLKLNALTRMIDRNVKYALSLKSNAYNKTWNSPEGRDSWKKAIIESFVYGASLPEMGSIVPFGQVVEFIPAIESFEFCMTTGTNAPFEWTEIDGIYENDICPISRMKGEFVVNFQKIGSPRGDLIGVAVYGFNRKAKRIIGEYYDVQRLLEKAKENSQGYKYYLADLAAFQKARGEGTLKIDDYSGKEYIEKTIPGWTKPKKLFESDITNPYDGPNRPEMLRKAAGKCYFRPKMKVRNSEAAINEIKEHRDDENIDTIITNTLDDALNQFPMEPVQQEQPVEQETPQEEPEIVDDNDKSELDFG